MTFLAEGTANSRALGNEPCKSCNLNIGWLEYSIEGVLTDGNGGGDRGRFGRTLLIRVKEFGLYSKCTWVCLVPMDFWNELHVSHQRMYLNSIEGDVNRNRCYCFSYIYSSFREIYFS